MDSPYKFQSKRAFWSKAVSRDYRVEDTVTTIEFLVQNDEKLASAGSCFASNMVPYLEQNGLKYIKSEKINDALCGLDIDNFGYSNFSAAYGNIYTSRQFLQLIKRAEGKFCPVEDRWVAKNGIVDPFRPSMKFIARSNYEFELLRAQHFRKTLEAFASADVFVFTLGLTEAWVSRIDGAVYPVCPGTVSGEFDDAKYEFKNFNVQETADDLTASFEAIRILNPHIRFILTVSPVPLVATATQDHVLVASTYSKSVLRVAAEIVSKTCNNTMYFPSYEMITGPQAPEDFIKSDKRSVTQKGVSVVMEAFLAHCDLPQNISENVAPPKTNIASVISSKIIDAECEEEALARFA